MNRNRHPLVILAKQAVETYIGKNDIIAPPDDLPKNFLNNKAGVFVTLTKDGGLRGCIGTYAGTKENIARETIANAIAAATQDPRFDRVVKGELPRLDYEVYILKAPEPVESRKELDPKLFGVIVTGKESKRSALLLPGLEGIDTVEQQLACACRKAGIDPDNEMIEVCRFTAEKY